MCARDRLPTVADPHDAKLAVNCQNGRWAAPPLEEPPGRLKWCTGGNGRALLKAHRGRRAELARKLGIGERTLYRRLRDIDQGSGT